MDPDTEGRGQERPSRRGPPAHETTERPIDRAIDVATNRLTDAEEKFVAAPPGVGAIDRADTVVRRAEDLELLAEEGSEEAQRGSGTGG